MGSGGGPGVGPGGARAGARGGQSWGQGGPRLGPGGARAGARGAKAGARGAMAPLVPPLATGLGMRQTDLRCRRWKKQVRTTTHPYLQGAFHLTQPHPHARKRKHGRS